MNDLPSGGHLDLDVLADVEEGVAAPADAATAHSHLQRCEQCQDRLGRLRSTRALLTALPADTMPPRVVDRVDAALAHAADPPTSPPTVVPMTTRGRRWNSPAVAGAAAAVAVLVLVGAVVAGNVVNGHRANRSSNSASSLANPAAPAQLAAGVKEWSTGNDYSAGNLATLVPRLVVGTPPADVGPSRDAGSVASPNSAVSGAGPAGTGGTPGFTQQELRASRTAVLACGRILAGGVPTTPIAVDFARFDGKPATVFVLPAVGHPTLLDVWVVRSACSASSLDLYWHRVARPAG